MVLKLNLYMLIFFISLYIDNVLQYCYIYYEMYMSILFSQPSRELP